MKWVGNEACQYFFNRGAWLWVSVCCPSLTLNWLENRGREVVFQIMGRRQSPCKHSWRAAPFSACFALPAATYGRSAMIPLQCRKILILTWCPRCRCTCQQNWWPAGLAQTLPSPGHCKWKIIAGQQRQAHKVCINFSQAPSPFLRQIHGHSITSTEIF